MLKRIIFDLDNTLIYWKDEYTYDLKKVVDKYNYDINPAKALGMQIYKVTSINDIYKLKEML